VRDDVVMRLQVGEEVSLDVQNRRARDEIPDDMMVAHLVREGGEEVALHAALSGW